MSIVLVAKHAGVSIATVSRVINNLDNVRDETASHVRAAMQHLGYTPPVVRRGPKPGKRRVDASMPWMKRICVMTPSSATSPLIDSVVEEILRSAEQVRASVVMCRAGEIVQGAEDIDGLICVGPRPADESGSIPWARNKPIVRVIDADDASGVPDDLDCDIIWIDPQTAETARMAVHQLGYRILHPDAAPARIQLMPRPFQAHARSTAGSASYITIPAGSGTRA